MSNLQPNCCLKNRFPKGGKWLIHNTKRRKDNQLQRLKFPCRISKLSSYSVHKKYANSNSCVNFNTNIPIIHNFINTTNWKYPFPSPFQISDTFVKYIESCGHYHDRRLISKKYTFTLWIEIDIFLCDMEFRLHSDIGFWFLIVIDKDIVTEHQKLSNQSNLHSINRFHSSKFNVDVIHSVKMIQGQYHGNHKRSMSV